MPEQPPSVSDEIAKFIGTTQAMVTLAAALGITALGQRAWTWLNRTNDERFLVALAAHAAALDRADALDRLPEKIDSATKCELERIADELTKQANNNIRAAIAQREWSMTRLAGIGPVGFAIGVFAFVIAIAQMSTPDPSGIWPWVVLGGWILALIAAIVGASVKAFWIRREMKRMEEHNRSGSDELADRHSCQLPSIDPGKTSRKQPPAGCESTDSPTHD